MTSDDDSCEITIPGDQPAEPIEKILAPFQRFLKAQTTSRILMIGVTVLALVWANSPWAESYHQLWHLNLAATVSDPIAIGILAGLVLGQRI